MSPTGFYLQTHDGRPCCAVCHGLDQTHAAACAVVVLHAQLRELSLQLGLFVATFHETMEVLEEQLRGDAPEEGPHGTH